MKLIERYSLVKLSRLRRVRIRKAGFRKEEKNEAFLNCLQAWIRILCHRSLHYIRRTLVVLQLLAHEHLQALTGEPQSPTYQPRFALWNNGCVWQEFMRTGERRPTGSAILIDALSILNPNEPIPSRMDSWSYEMTQSVTVKGPIYCNFLEKEYYNRLLTEISGITGNQGYGWQKDTSYILGGWWNTFAMDRQRGTPPPPKKNEGRCWSVQLNPRAILSSLYVLVYIRKQVLQEIR